MEDLESAGPWDATKVHCMVYYILPKFSFPPSVPPEITLHVERKHR